MSDRILTISEVGAALEHATGGKPRDDFSLPEDARKLCDLYGRMIYLKMEKLRLNEVNEPYKSLLEKWLPEEARQEA